MKQAFMTLPVMTGDVSGVCSALYELGGLIVMHDPSGCNSTYNTHDEIRWYDEPSLIFISGLNAHDAIMGNEDKLIHDVVKAAQAYQPAFITLCNSPIPYIMGMDFAAICRLIEKRTQIPTFYVATNAMHTYVHGASAALQEVISRLGEHRPADRFSVNLLGTTPLDYTNRESINSLVRLMEASGWICHNLSFQSSLEDVKASLSADVNLVVSALGLKAAQWMEKTYGIPYVCGLPLKGAEDEIRELLERRETCLAYQTAYDEQAEVVVLGDPIIAGMIAHVLRKQDIHATMIATNEADPCLGLSLDHEEELMAALKHHQVVIGDPLYRYVMPSSARLISLPHFALSGRLYVKDIPNLLSIDWRHIYEFK